MFYTSLPVIALGTLDQDVGEAHCLRFPRLYTPGRLDLFFSREKFAWSAAHGVMASLTLVGFVIG
jgi:phospholipid-translocating ATPase